MEPDDAVPVNDVVAERYVPDQDRTLSGALLEAIESHRGEDLTESECTLYDDIDPDSLGGLFGGDAQPNTVVEFDTDDVRVMLWDDDGVEIRVTSLPST